MAKYLWCRVCGLPSVTCGYVRVLPTVKLRCCDILRSLLGGLDSGEIRVVRRELVIVTDVIF